MINKLKWTREPTRTPYEQSKSAINRRFCYSNSVIFTCCKCERGTKLRSDLFTQKEPPQELLLRRFLICPIVIMHTPNIPLSECADREFS